MSSHPPGMTPYPHAYPVVMAPSPYPQQVPPGYGWLCAEFNRGPYLIPATATTRLKVSGQEPPTGLSPGRWYYPVQAGQHQVKITDLFGIPMMTTDLTVRAGETHYLRFHFGGWRNRVRDGTGADVTRFGMWSNYTIGLISLGVIGLCCCGGLFAVSSLLA